MTIDELLFENIRPRFTSQCFECTVISVDKNTDTCILKPAEDEKANIENARLTATIETKTTKIVAYPTVGSTVTVAILNNIKTDCTIIKLSEIEEIDIRCDKITYNQGIGGIIHIIPFLLKLNATVEQLKAAVLAGFTAQTSIDSSLGLNAYTPIAALVLPLVKTDFEDTKIKH